MTAAHAALLGAAVLVAAPSEAQPARIGPTIRELTEVADVEALSAAHRADRVAFRVQRGSIVDNDYKLEWYVADPSSDRTIKIGDGGAPINTEGVIESEPAVWSQDDRFIYFRALVDGVIGVWRAAVDGSGSRPVIRTDADVEHFELSKDGRTLSYVLGPSRHEIWQAERDEYDAGILVDATVDPTQTLYHGAYIRGRLATQRLIGRWVSKDGLLWDRPRRRHSLDLASGVEIASEPVPVDKVQALRLSSSSSPTRAEASGRVATIVAFGNLANIKLSRPGQKDEICSASACAKARIRAIAWRPDSAELLFTTQDTHTRQSLFVWDTATGSVRPIAKSEGLLGGGRTIGIPCAITHANAVCVAADAVAPPKLVSFALADGAQRVLFDPNPSIRARAQPTVEHLSVTLRDGRTTTAVLLLPSAQTKWAPLFITYYYCQGYLRGGIGDEFPMPQLVDAGFAVACVNIVPFDKWGRGIDRYTAALEAISALVDQLEGRGLIDRGKVGMGGFSAGSEATMFIAMNSNLLSAAGISSTQIEPGYYWSGSIRGRDFATVLRDFMQLGDPETDLASWRKVSPGLNTARIKAPLLMQFPEREMRGSLELYSKLSNSRTPAELYAYPDESHNKYQPRHRFAVYNRYLDWFRYWLQSYVDPDPAKSKQYERWQLLRERRGK